MMQDCCVQIAANISSFFNKIFSTVRIMMEKKIDAAFKYSNCRKLSYKRKKARIRRNAVLGVCVHNLLDVW